PDRGEIVALLHRDLALAVIAEPRGLENGAWSDLCHRRRQGRNACDVTVSGGGNAVGPEKILLLKPVLADRKDARPRMNGPMLCEDGGGRGGHVLELEGHDIDRVGETRQRALVVIGGDRCEGRNLHRRTVGLGAENVTAIAKRSSGQRGHAAELAAAENADDAAGFDHPRVTILPASRPPRRYAPCATCRAPSRSWRRRGRECPPRAARRWSRRPCRWRACRPARHPASARWRAANPCP